MKYLSAVDKLFLFNSVYMLEIIAYFCFLVYFFLPTFFANWAPIVAKNIICFKRWKTPINEKLFWKNKTYRGFVLWVLTAIVLSIIEYFLVDFIPFTSIVIHYHELVSSFSFAVFFWFLQWFWALFGDIVKSFIKRRIGIAPGEAWPVFDGIDYVLGSLIFMSPFFLPSFLGIIFILVIWPISSLIANIIAYLIGWKDVWY